MPSRDCGAESNVYCTLHCPQQERYVEKKISSLVTYVDLYAITLYVVHLFEHGLNVNALQFRWTGIAHHTEEVLHRGSLYSKACVFRCT